MIIDIKECKQVLEAAIGEADYIIPQEIIQSTIQHLTDYETLKFDVSWDCAPEAMGR